MSKKSCCFCFSIDLEKSNNVFTPTGTSKVLVDAIIENVKNKKKVLDLGCGCGAIGLSLFKNNIVKELRILARKQ